MSLITLLITPIFPLVLGKIRSKPTDHSANRHIALASPLVPAEFSSGETADQSACHTDAEALQRGVEVLVEFFANAGA
jgi:hypothetical protein